MAREKPVGIDLGTTNSAVAWVDESGRSEMVRNAEGDLLTPSVVLFGDAEVVVGKEARSATTVNPETVAEWVKRDMGQPVYCRPIHGKHLPPEVIQACILRKLNADLTGTLGPDGKVVITVPAYFDEPRRKATADAGELAGLSVLDIVNEPTAAALAFGETIGYLSPAGGPREKMTVLVYDLGGGTFDVTLLKLAPGDIRTIATDGDVQLGGHDWDERLVDYIAESFKKSHGIDPREDPAGKNRILNAVIESKHTLSARSRASIRVDYKGKASEVQITRDLFKELTADLLERTSYTTRQLLSEAKLQWKDVSRLLLVGGSTRMPMVTEMLRELTDVTPDRTVNPDEAVARGAAIYAGYLLAKRAEGGSQATFEVTNVNAHSLGMEGIDQETLRKKNVILIPRNTSLPAKFTERFITKSEDQRSIVVQVLEGESSLPGECTAIGRTVIRDLPGGLPKGWPIEVTFEYGTNGRLSVQTVVPGTHRQMRLELERAAGLSGEGIARWKQPVACCAGFDAFEAMVQEVLDTSKPGLSTPPGEQPSQPADDQPATQSVWASAPTPAGGIPSWPEEPAHAAAGAHGPQPPAHAAAGAHEPQPPADATAEQPIGQPDAQTQSAPYLEDRSAATRPVSRWVTRVIGHVVAALIGLGLGYLVLNWMKPESFRLPW